jgi:HPt (histidine-containing phosphotransfer) domain-containing protein
MEPPAPVLDVELLSRLFELEQQGEDSGMLAKLVRGYLASIPPQLGRMRELLAAGEASALAHEAHGLAGSSAMYGLPRLRQRCKALEARARSGELEDAGALLDEVQRAFEEARPLLLAELSLPEG